jgi:hypothetical protein
VFKREKSREEWKREERDSPTRTWRILKRYFSNPWKYLTTR